MMVRIQHLPEKGYVPSEEEENARVTKLGMEGVAPPPTPPAEPPTPTEDIKLTP